MCVSQIGKDFRPSDARFRVTVEAGPERVNTAGVDRRHGVKDAAIARKPVVAILGRTP
jgi:hypothetical protein